MADDRIGYVLTGADRETGRDCRLLLVDAPNRDRAAKRAADLGMVVSSIRRASVHDVATMLPGIVETFHDEPRPEPPSAAPPSEHTIHTPAEPPVATLSPELRAALLRIADAPIITMPKQAVASGIAYVMLLLYILALAPPLGVAIGLGIGAIGNALAPDEETGALISTAAILLFSLAGLVVWFVALSKLLRLALRKW